MSGSAPAGNPVLLALNGPVTDIRPVKRPVPAYMTAGIISGACRRGDRVGQRANTQYPAAGRDDDALTGDAGRDTFVFAAGYGFDRVKDWEDGLDRIDLSEWNVTSFDDLTITDLSGPRVRITDGTGNRAVIRSLEGTFDVADLTAEDFIFG